MGDVCTGSKHILYERDVFKVVKRKERSPKRKRLFITKASSKRHHMYLFHRLTGPCVQGVHRNSKTVIRLVVGDTFQNEVPKMELRSIVGLLQVSSNKTDKTW